jgi:ferric-dicitrate binding protein FerR (iron transport regulator)
MKLGALLATAGAASDWDRLDAATRELGPQLARLAAQGPWNDAERAALARLRAAHDGAAAACGAAAAALAARLDEMRNNKDGWIAYAMGATEDRNP